MRIRKEKLLIWLWILFLLFIFVMFVELLTCKTKVVGNVPCIDKEGREFVNELCEENICTDGWVSKFNNFMEGFMGKIGWNIR